MISTLQLLGSSPKPTLLLASRLGSLYNLIPSNQNNVEVIHLSVGDFLHIKQDVLEKLPEHLSFKKYLGYQDHILTYLAPHDFYKVHKQIQHNQPRKHHPEHEQIREVPKEQNKEPKHHKQPRHPKQEKAQKVGSNEPEFVSMSGCGDGSIKVFTNKGYQKVTDKEYYEMVKLIKPDIWVGFTEMSLLSNKSETLSKKSIFKSIKKSSQFLKMIKDEKKQGLLLAPVHGGTTQHISASMNEIMKYESIVDGLLICDVSESTTNEEIVQILKTIKEHTQGKQFLICLASEGRIERLELFKQGVHMFEVNYPFRVAEENKALVKGKEHVPVQRQDLSPLDSECGCLSCTSYSQSYIAHLLKCHEMTANVLLTIHNLHQYSVYKG